MKLRIKLVGLAVYAAIATGMFWVGGGVHAEAPKPAPEMAGEHCPKGHAKG